MNPLVPFITAAMGLLKKSPEGQKRRNLKIAKKTLKQLTKEFKKDGLDPEEIALLNKLRNAIVEKAAGL